MKKHPWIVGSFIVVVVIVLLFFLNLYFETNRSEGLLSNQDSRARMGQITKTMVDAGIPTVTLDAANKKKFDKLEQLRAEVLKYPGNADLHFALCDEVLDNGFILDLRRLPQYSTQLEIAIDKERLIHCAKYIQLDPDENSEKNAIASFIIYNAPGTLSAVASKDETLQILQEMNDLLPHNEFVRNALERVDIEYQ